MRFEKVIRVLVVVVGTSAFLGLLSIGGRWWDGIRKLDAGLGVAMTPGELIADALAGSNTFHSHRRSRQA